MILEVKEHRQIIQLINKKKKLRSDAKVFHAYSREKIAFKLYKHRIYLESSLN